MKVLYIAKLLCMVKAIRLTDKDHNSIYHIIIYIHDIMSFACPP